jgi:hypothetical protein
MLIYPAFNLLMGKSDSATTEYNKSITIVHKKYFLVVGKLDVRPNADKVV